MAEGEHITFCGQVKFFDTTEADEDDIKMESGESEEVLDDGGSGHGVIIIRMVENPEDKKEPDRPEEKRETDKLEESKDTVERLEEKKEQDTPKEKKEPDRLEEDIEPDDRLEEDIEPDDRLEEDIEIEDTLEEDMQGVPKKITHLFGGPQHP